MDSPRGAPAIVQALAAPSAAIDDPRPPGGAPTAKPTSQAQVSAAYSAGRRRALCVGIDRYPRQPLAGCVADARAWARSLQGLGFASPTLLVDEAATRQGIVDAVRALKAGSRPGDVLAFQYSGHGTLLPDLDGDESAGSTPGQDQAIVPFDFDTGAFLIDDDIYELLTALPDGVNLTCFFDCCHSGTLSRFAVGGGPMSRGGDDRRARFLAADGDMIEAHRRFRARGPARGQAVSRPAELMQWVVFSACLDREVAYETGGHGEFTVRATQMLARGIDGLTHLEFQRKVTEAFGATPAQHPNLDCAPAAGTCALLQPLIGAPPAPARGVAGSRNGDLSGVARDLHAVAEALLARSQKP